jgi:hypothetical protein
MRKLQNYVLNIAFVGAIMDDISMLLDKNNDITRSIVGHSFLTAIYTVEHYSNKLE